MPSHLYAILIGINRYQSQSLRDLEFAVADVLGIREVFRERMDLADERMRMLTTSGLAQVSGPVSRSGVLKALNDFTSAPMKPEDSFVLYFAGHGFSDEHETCYLMTEESDPASAELLEDTAIPLKTLLRYLDKIKANQQLIILDACRNQPDSLGRQVSSARFQEGTARDVGVLTKGAQKKDQFCIRNTLSACWKGQASYEYPGGRHSWFCYHLIQSLRETPGEIEVTELKRTIEERMTEQAFQLLSVASAQTPHLETDGDVIRLQLSPIEIPITRPLPAPEQVRIEEPDVPELKIDAPSIEAAQVTTEGLPPLSGELLELEGKVEGLKQALKSLEDETHPSLQSAQSTVKSAETQYLNLKTDLEKNTPAELSSEELEAIHKAVDQDPFSEITPLLDLVQSPISVETSLLPLIHRQRNVVRAKRAHEQARERYEGLVSEQSEILTSELDTLSGELEIAHEQDLKKLLFTFFDNHADSASEFPLQAWMELLPKIQKRRYSWEGSDLVKRAEALHKIWQQRLNEEQNWQTTDTNDLNALDSFLQKFPAGHYSDKARHARLPLLRMSLCNDTSNVARRVQYLRDRTDKLEELDRSRAKASLHGWACGGVIAWSGIVILSRILSREGSLDLLPIMLAIPIALASGLCLKARLFGRQVHLVLPGYLHLFPLLGCAVSVLGFCYSLGWGSSEAIETILSLHDGFEGLLERMLETSSVWSLTTIGVCIFLRLLVPMKPRALTFCLYSGIAAAFLVNASAGVEARYLDSVPRTRSVMKYYKFTETVIIDGWLWDSKEEREATRIVDSGERTHSPKAKAKASTTAGHCFLSGIFGLVAGALVGACFFSVPGWAIANCICGFIAAGVTTQMPGTVGPAAATGAICCVILMLGISCSKSLIARFASVGPLPIPAYFLPVNKQDREKLMNLPRK